MFAKRIFLSFVVVILVFGYQSAAIAQIEAKYLVADPPARKALVIANSEYDILDPIDAVKNDSDRVASAFERMNFDVTAANNVATARELLRTIHQFSREIDRDDLVVVYYSGHGFSLNGFSYMAPTQMPKTGTMNEMAEAGVPIENLYDFFDRAEPGYVLVIFDACRNIPDLALSDAPDIIGKGGYSVNNNAPQTANFSIHYASSLGEAVPTEDDTDALSPFTDHLLRQEHLFNREYSKVLTATNRSLSLDDWNIVTTFAHRAMIDLLLNEDEDNLTLRRQEWEAVLNENLTAQARWLAVSHFAKFFRLSPYAKAADRWLDDNPEPISVARADVRGANGEVLPSTEVPQTMGRSALPPDLVEQVWRVQATSQVIQTLALLQGSFGLPRLKSSAPLSNSPPVSERDYGSLFLRVSEDASQPSAFEEAYARILIGEGLIVSSGSLDIREQPRFGAATALRVPGATPLIPLGVERQADNNLWFRLGSVGSQGSEVLGYARVDVTSAAALSLGDNLAEIVVEPSPHLPTVLDSDQFAEQFESVREQSTTIGFVSVVSGRIDDGHPEAPRKKLQNEALLRHAGYLLRRAGIEGTKITFITSAEDFKAEGVRMRFFGARR